MIKPSENLPSELAKDITTALVEHFCFTGRERSCNAPAHKVELMAVIQAVLEKRKEQDVVG